MSHVKTILYCLVIAGLLGFAAQADARTNAQDLLQQGQALMAEERFEEALAVFDQGLSHYPHNLGLKVARGQALVRLGRYEEAEALYQRMLGGGPAAVKAAYVEMAALYARMKQYKKAHDYYSLAIQEYPGRGDLYLARGSMSMEMGDYEIAEADYKAAAKVSPSMRAASFYYRAINANRQEDFKTTFAMLDKAACAKPDKGLANAVEQLREASVKEQRVLKPWAVTINTGVRFDTNVPLEPDDGFQSFGGSRTQNEDISGLLRATLTGYFKNTREVKYGVDYTVFTERYAELTQFNQLVQHVGFFYAFNNDPWYFNIRTDFGYYRSDNENFQALFALTPSLTRVWNKDHRTMFTGYYAYKARMDDVSDDIHRLVGNAVHFQTFVHPKKDQAVGVVGRAGLHLEREIPVGDRAWNYMVYEIQTGVSFPMPWRLEGDLGASMAFADYAENNFIAPGRERFDNRYYLSAKVGRQINDLTRLDLYYHFTYNDSNLDTGGLDLYQFKRNVLTLLFTGNF